MIRPASISVHGRFSANAEKTVSSENAVERREPRFIFGQNDAESANGGQNSRLG